jgi:teichuronic acid biosynthesis glycosyltransferase TuaG
MNSLVSVVIPCYNSKSYIQFAVESVLNQTYSNIEVIIVDDCSNDESTIIIDRLKRLDNRIVLIQLPNNLGVSNARNIGIAVAKGRFIAFLDSDDLWDNSKLHRQVTLMLQNKLSICYSAYRKIDTSGKILSNKISVNECGVSYNDLLLHNEIGFLTSIYDTKKIGKPYFKNIGHEDYAYWLDILNKGYNAYGINEVLASYRVHSNSLSYNKFKAAGYTWNIYINVEKLGLVRALYCFFSYCIYSTLKKIK